MWIGHGTLDRILLMWDRWVAQKLEDCMGNFSVAYSLFFISKLS
jgi:hypothetical protein